MPPKHHKINRKKAINSSYIVFFLTGISFFGFFLRDYLMAKIYGFGRELDMFYLATMIPMFMVTVFCLPFGQSVVPILKKIQNPQPLSLTQKEKINHIKESSKYLLNSSEKLTKKIDQESDE